MGEYRGERSYDRAYTRPIEIEGRIETPFSEVEFGQTQPIALPQSISWDTAQLRFEPVNKTYSVPSGPFGSEEPVLLYEGVLDFVSANDRVDTIPFTRVTSRHKPILFTGSRSGFYAHDPEMIGRSNPFYLVGIQPDELDANMSRLNAIYHELGHVIIFHNQYDVQLFQAAAHRNADELPDMVGIQPYAQFLARAMRRITLSQDAHISSRQHINHFAHESADIAELDVLFHERYAWAAGGRLMMRYGLPTGFTRPTSFTTYAEYCLGTYAKGYNNQRFVDGWAKDR